MTESASPATPLWVRRLLWMDGGGGLLVGLVVLSLHGNMAGWYGLPEHIVLLTGAANMAYGLYSLQLAARRVRPRVMLRGLALANGAWTIVCAVLLLRHGVEATWLGQGHLVLEGLYVAALAVLEWRFQDLLRFR